MRRSDRSDTPGQRPPPTPGKERVASLLNALRPAVTRYRPVVVWGLGLAVLLVIGLGFLTAFGGGHRPSPPQDRASAEAEPAEAPAPIDDRLPASYGELGPDPLAPPATSVAGVAAAPGGTRAAPAAGDDARRQWQEETRAAQASGPFFGGGGRRAGLDPVSPPPVARVAPADAVPADAVLADAADAGLGGVGAKAAFVARAARESRTQTASLPAPAVSPYEIKAGSVIAAALLTGLNSDLPGMVVAQVTQPVFDHRTGRLVLVPQGARLIGKYDSQVGHGQDRVLLVWTRLIFPSGRSVELGAMTGADATGASGLSDQVDSHLPVLARAIGLSTLITVGGAVAQNGLSRSSDTVVLRDGAGGVAAQASQTGQHLVERDLQRAPTLRVRPGFPVRVMIDKDLVLPPEAEVVR